MDTDKDQNAQQKRQGQCWPEGIERARRVAVKLHRLEVILHAGLLCDEYAYAGWGGAEYMAAGMKPSLVALDAALDSCERARPRPQRRARLSLRRLMGPRRESGASRCLFGGRRRPARPGDGRGQPAPDEAPHAGHR